MNFIEPKYGTGESIADSVRADAALEAAIRASRILIVDDQKMVRELPGDWQKNGLDYAQSPGLYQLAQNVVNTVERTVDGTVENAQ